MLTFVDITERKRDEMELRERAELLTLAQRVAGAGVWSVNPDTGATFISDECRELIGFRGRPDVSGLNQWIDEVCHPDDRDRLRQARDAATGGERDLDLEFRVLLEEHGERWILLRSRRMVGSDEHINNVVGMTVDITERKQHEAELERLYLTESEARAQAEEAVRARDQFLSIASHELRTPLTTVQGYASMLERRARDAANNPARTERIVNTIVRQTERLNALIEQLLDASRLQRGQFELERHPLDLGDLVSRSADDYRLVLPAEVEGQPVHAIVLDRGVDHLAVLGDANRLEEVLQNLLNNAVKYSPEGGEIQVRLRRESSDAILEVEDHGVGIDEEALPHLAEPFYRVKSEDRGDIGFGIGLFVVDEIVKRHGGRVEVESVLGDGSTFRVILPLIDAAE